MRRCTSLLDKGTIKTGVVIESTLLCNDSRRLSVLQHLLGCDDSSGNDVLVDTQVCMFLEGVKQIFVMSHLGKEVG